MCHSYFRVSKKGEVTEMMILFKKIVLEAGEFCSVILVTDQEFTASLQGKQ